MPKGEMKESSIQSTEAPQGLEPKRLTTTDALKEYWSEIKDLSANALDTSEGRSYGERKDEVKEDHLYHEYLKSGKHGELYVLLKNGKVVAFLAIKKSVSDKEAEIEQLRLVRGPEQRRYIEEILEFAKTKLEEQGYHHGVANSEAANERFLRFANHIKRFLRIEKDESSEGLKA